MWLGSHVALSASAGFVGRWGDGTKRNLNKSSSKARLRTMRVCAFVSTPKRTVGGGRKRLASDRVGTVGKKTLGSSPCNCRPGLLQCFPRVEKANFLVLPIGFSVGARVIKKKREGFKERQFKGLDIQKVHSFSFFFSLPAPSPHFLELQPPQEAECVSAAVSLQSAVRQQKQRHEISACVWAVMRDMERLIKHVSSKCTAKWLLIEVWPLLEAKAAAGP